MIANLFAGLLGELFAIQIVVIVFRISIVHATAAVVKINTAIYICKCLIFCYFVQPIGNPWFYVHLYHVFNKF